MPPLPPRKPKSHNETVTIYGPRKLWARLAEIAAADGRSKSELIVAILEEWLAAFEKEQRRR